MRKLDPALERRRNERNGPRRVCELVVGELVYPATIVDTSRGGLFVLTEAPAERGVPVSVLEKGDERLAVVVHVRRPARSLLRVTTGGLGLRWLLPH